MAVTVDEILVADPPRSWASAGFTVGPDGVCRVGRVRVRLLGSKAGRGIVGWSLRGLPSGMTDLDGVPTTASDAPPPEPASHSIGVTSIDHVVLLSPDLARTAGALAAVGLEPRRERDGKLGGMLIRQVFFRLGEVILEVVGPPDSATEGPSTLWGLTHTVRDIDAAAARLDKRASTVKDAVQPGRRITTLRNRDLGMSVRTALISPPVRSNP